MSFISSKFLGIITAVGGGAILIYYLKQQQQQQQKQKELEKNEYMIRVKGKSVPNVKEELSEVDEGLTYSWISFSLRYERILDVKLLVKGLEKLMQVYPCVGGRFKHFDNPSPSQIILNGEGIDFQVVEYTNKNSVFGPDSELPDDNSLISSWEPIQFEPSSAIPGDDDPLVKCKLTVFKEENISYISMSINHVLGDAETYVRLMNTWGDACRGKELPPTQCGERVCKPLRKVKNKEELINMWETEIGGAYDLDPETPKKLMPHFAENAKNVFTEFRVVNEELKKRKAEIMKTLPKGEFVSSYEVLMGSLLHVAYQNRKDPQSIYFACNVRERSNRFKPGYFGNGAHDLEIFNFKACETIEETIFNFHKEVRKLVNQKDEKITARKDWLETARALGLSKELATWVPIKECVYNRAAFINSWTRYSWLDTSFYENEYPSTCACRPIYFTNTFLDYPRSKNGDSTIHLPTDGINFEQLKFLKKI